MPRSLTKPADGYPPRICTGCGEEYVPTRSDQSVCTKACRTATTSFERSRSQKAYRALYHWGLSGGRMGKGAQGASLGDISRLVRGWIEEDRREGRAVPALPFTNR